MISNEGNKTKRFKAFIGKDIVKAGLSGYDGQIIGLKSIEINGNPVLLCIATAGFDLWPRGILAYNFEKNEEQWHYWIGGCPHPNSVVLLDINGDGQKEIISGTYATCNGAVANGVDDFNSYLIVLNSKGELLWKKSIGDRSTGILCWAGFLNRNGDTCIVACEVMGLASKKNANKILILRARDGEPIKYLTPGEQFLGFKVCDYNRDGDLEIITGNSDGVLRIFDGNLEIIKEKNFDNGITLAQVEDINGDGTNEILCTTQDGRLIILNENLKILCNYKLQSGMVDCVYLAQHRKKFNIITRSVLGIECIYTISKVVTAPGLPSAPISLFWLLISILLASGLVYAIVDKVKYRKKIKYLIDESPYGVIILNSKNKITYYNYKVVKFVGENRPEILKFLGMKDIQNWLKKPTEPKNIDINFQQKHFTVYSSLVGNEKMFIICDRTSEFVSRDIITWSGFAQKLAHEIKNPLSTINLTLQRMQEVCREKLGKDAEALDHYTDSVLEEVARLRDTTDKFMRVLSLEKPHPVSCDINLLLENTLQKYKTTLPTEIKFQKSYAKELPPVKCDESQMLMVFSNIIENAIEAMEGKGVLTLRTALIENIGADAEKVVKYVEIKFEDTGKGISEDQLKNLFKPFHSTKPGGTGLGLVIARRIVEEHSGKIEITSKEGIGTVVSILLSV